MKKILTTIILIVLVAVTGVYYSKQASLDKELKSTTTSKLNFVSSSINADGTVVAASQARLAFQTSGKLVYLPYKEGDKVYAGSTIARLDTYALQRQLTSALNLYRSNRDSFDQLKDNAQNGVQTAQMTNPYDYYVKAGLDTGTRQDAINTAVKRIVDQYQANLDNAVVSVELANYAIQLANLTSPINGIITREDVQVTGVNITPATTFTVADPESMVFRANIPLENIYYISEGSTVSIALDGLTKKLTGIVTKIYPSKVTLPTGAAVYQVDVVSDDLKKVAKFDQTGSAIIMTNAQNVALVPAWTVLSGKYIWVNEDGTPKLKEIKVGKTHGKNIEVISGLSENDQIIIDPQKIVSLKYKFL